MITFLINSAQSNHLSTAKTAELVKPADKPPPNKSNFLSTSTYLLINMVYQFQIVGSWSDQKLLFIFKYVFRCVYNFSDHYIPRLIFNYAYYPVCNGGLNALLDSGKARVSLALKMNKKCCVICFLHWQHKRKKTT